MVGYSRHRLRSPPGGPLGSYGRITLEGEQFEMPRDSRLTAVAVFFPWLAGFSVWLGLSFAISQQLVPALEFSQSSAVHFELSLKADIIFNLEKEQR